MGSMGKDLEDGRTDADRQEQVYGMRPLGSVDSQEQIECMNIAPDGPNRTRSVKTGISEGISEALECEPEHVLNNKKR
jgi:hypothetical protein